MMRMISHRKVTQEGQRRTGDQDPFPVRINISKLTPGDPESMVQILIDEYKETSVALSLDQNGNIQGVSHSDVCRSH